MNKSLIDAIDKYNKCSKKCDPDNKYKEEWNKRDDIKRKKGIKYYIDNMKEIQKEINEKAHNSVIVKNFNICMLKKCKKHLKDLIKQFIPILESELNDIDKKNKEIYNNQLNLINDLKSIDKWSNEKLEKELYKLATKKPNFLY